MSLKSNFIRTSKITILALALTLGTNMLFAAWQAPTQTPPNGNVPAPLNQGGVDQTKAGGLAVNAFAAAANSFFAGNVTIGTPTAPAHFKLVDGNQAQGKVLTSDVNGNASWQTNANVSAPTSAPACSWTGVKAVYGNVNNPSNCSDDVYITCTAGRVTDMTMGC